MDKFWEIAVTVAGLGGVASFVLWSLYKRWLDLDIFQQMTKEQQFSLFRMFFLLTFLFAVIATMAYTYTAQGEHKLPPTTAPTTPTTPVVALPPQNRARFREPEDYIVVEFGDHFATLRGRDGGEFPWVISVGAEGKFPLEISILGGDAVVSAKFHDGALAVELCRNVLLTRPAGWDFNRNDAAMELVDASGAVYLQVVYISSRRIAVKGILDWGESRVLVNKRFEVNPPDLENRKFEIKPIFRHPSWQYPGQFAS